MEKIEQQQSSTSFFPSYHDSSFSRATPRPNTQLFVVVIVMHDAYPECHVESDQHRLDDTGRRRCLHSIVHRCVHCGSFLTLFTCTHLFANFRISKGRENPLWNSNTQNLLPLHFHFFSSDFLSPRLFFCAL